MDFTLYPNPANDALNLRFYSNDVEKLALDVFDITGQLILEETKFSSKGIQSWRLNTSSLSNGAYFLRMNSAKNNYTQSFTIAK